MLATIVTIVLWVVLGIGGMFALLRELDASEPVPFESGDIIGAVFGGALIGPLALVLWALSVRGEIR